MHIVPQGIPSAVLAMNTMARFWCARLLRYLEQIVISVSQMDINRDRGDHRGWRACVEGRMLDSASFVSALQRLGTARSDVATRITLNEDRSAGDRLA